MNHPATQPEALLSVDTALNQFFEQSIENATKIDPSYERLWKNLYSLIQSGGKRLRPKMTILAYEAFGGDDIDSIAPVAAAQELLHFSMLIHDDVIDRDYIRYGVANIAGRYKLEYSQYISSPDNLTHYAHSAAILGGDLMLSGAHQLIALSDLSGKDKAIAQQLLSAGIFEVAGGELIDTELSFTPYLKGDALKVATHKTASYSFVLPLLTGARLAGASDEQCAILKSYAAALGIAYQLTDDLLGLFGDEQATGKSTVSDIVEGKRTYMVEVALEAFSPSDQASFMVAFGNPAATPLEINSAKRLLETSGARQKTEQKASEYTKTALSSLDQLQLAPEHHQKLLEMVNKVTSRSS